MMGDMGTSGSGTPDSLESIKPMCHLEVKGPYLDVRLHQALVFFFQIGTQYGENAYTQMDTKSTTENNNPPPHPLCLLQLYPYLMLSIQNPVTGEKASTWSAYVDLLVDTGVCTRAEKPLLLESKAPAAPPLNYQASYITPSFWFCGRGTTFGPPPDSIASGLHNVQRVITG